jgi:hypothetical protein
VVHDIASTSRFTIPEQEIRAVAISERLSSPLLGGHFVMYKGQYKELPIVDLPQEFLVYRADNGRLMLELQQLQKRRGLQPSYFHDNQDDASVQKDLHVLLLKLSKDQVGPIFQELQRLKQQTEPLLITAQGVVVNGNRRLAAMRQLLHEDSKTYQGFSKIRVAVMPKDAQNQDIEYVEAALQLAPETKLAYSWINRRLKLRRQKNELKLQVPLILESYRLQSAKVLDCELEELELAEMYLRDYCGQPGQYETILDAEMLFVGLNASLKHAAVSKRDLWRLAGFAMIFSRAELQVNLEGYFPFAAPKPAFAPDLALVELAREEGIEQREQDEGSVDLPPRAEKLLADVLWQKDEAKRLSLEIVNILDQIRIDQNKREAPKRLLHNINNARRLAERLEAGALTKQQKAEFGSELAAITHHSKRLLETGEEAPPPLSLRRRRLRKLVDNPYAYLSDSQYPVLRKLKVLFKPKKDH